MKEFDNYEIEENKMEESKVAFETAKLAKEKGFNEPSTHVYTIGFNSIKKDKIVRKFGNYENNDKLLQPIILSKRQIHLALAPTQSLLQRWLREIHDIYVFIDHSSHHVMHYEVLTDDDHIIGLNTHSYEEALESGLLRALKLIK